MGSRKKDITSRLRIFAIGHKTTEKPGQRVEQNTNMMRKYRQYINIALGY
jgi:hypothetical protein